jgi:hypothetical protein
VGATFIRKCFPAFKCAYTQEHHDKYTDVNRIDKWQDAAFTTVSQINKDVIKINKSFWLYFFL